MPSRELSVFEAPDTSGAGGVNEQGSSEGEERRSTRDPERVVDAGGPGVAMASGGVPNGSNPAPRAD